MKATWDVRDGMKSIWGVKGGNHIGGVRDGRQSAGVSNCREVTCLSEKDEVGSQHREVRNGKKATCGVKELRAKSV